MEYIMKSTCMKSLYHMYLDLKLLPKKSQWPFQCCFPKWQAFLFKTTLYCKMKKASIKKPREVATGSLLFRNLIRTCYLEELFWIVNLPKSKILFAKIEFVC